MVYSARLKLRSSLGRDTGYGDLFIWVGENCSRRPVGGSLTSQLLRTMPGKEEGAERKNYLLKV